jgi:replicative DNA helicase
MDPDITHIGDIPQEILIPIMDIEVVAGNLEADMSALVDLTEAVHLDIDIKRVMEDEELSLADRKDKIQQIIQRESGGPKKNKKRTAKDLASEYIKTMDDSYTPDYLRTGWDHMDEMVKMEKGDLIIVAGRPSMGKTAFALSMILNMGKRGSRGMFFSLEMGERPLSQRIISNLATVDMGVIVNNSQNLSTQHAHKVTGALQTLADMDFETVTDVFTISGIVNECKRAHREKPLDFIVVDYLQLIGGGKGENRTTQVGDLSIRLKRLAMELGVPVIALSQLSRGVEQRADRRPMMSDLRESGQIEQDASVIYMLYRDEYYNEDSEFKGMCEVLIPKNRNGEVGSIHMACALSMQKFGELRRV